MGRGACLAVSSRPSGQRQRRPDGRTCSCCSGERQLDGGWRIVVDCERQHSRPGCRGTGEQSCVDSGASWCRAGAICYLMTTFWLSVGHLDHILIVYSSLFWLRVCRLQLLSCGVSLSLSSIASKWVNNFFNHFGRSAVLVFLYQTSWLYSDGIL